MFNRGQFIRANLFAGTDPPVGDNGRRSIRRDEAAVVGGFRERSLFNKVDVMWINVPLCRVI